MNILQPLYEACLERMQGFVEDEEGRREREKEKGKKEKGLEDSRKFSDFRETLAQVAKHPNRNYFIYKSIILNNLYGVDIMEEATEICKLRLFLKLVSQVEVNPSVQNMGLEPLPDIDFNIRAGNTLVGFATLEEVRRAITQEEVKGKKEKGKGEEAAQFKLDLGDDLSRINEAAEIADRAYQLFRQMQTQEGMDGKVFAEAKQEVRRRLKALNEELNIYLAKEYSVDPNDAEAYQNWLKSHQPFHWLVEFYGIVSKAKFNVVIGNPPYVEWSKIKTYEVLSNTYATKDCGNIYTAVCERSYKLLGNKGDFGMIIPLSCIATERMKSFRDVWKLQGLLTYISNYSGDAHPSVLFEGVKFRLSILLQRKRDEGFKYYSTHFMRWLPDGRKNLFSLIEYVLGSDDLIRISTLPKLSSVTHLKILEKVIGCEKKIGEFTRDDGEYSVYAHRIVAHFIKALDFVPFFQNERDGIKKSEDYKIFSVETEYCRDALVAILNSSLFYSWFVSYSDVYHCGRKLILDFPCDLHSLSSMASESLKSKVNDAIDSLQEKSVRRSIPYKSTGMVEYDEFYPRLSKDYFDQLDVLIAQHYGFTDEELDFIINYDIKYRMGLDALEEDDD